MSLRNEVIFQNRSERYSFSRADEKLRGGLEGKDLNEAC